MYKLVLAYLSSQGSRAGRFKQVRVAQADHRNAGLAGRDSCSATCALLSPSM